MENVAASVVKQEAVSQPLSCAIWTSTNHMVGMVVVDGLHLFGGAQLAVDTTLVSTLHGDGSARRRAADEDGVALAAARKVKETPSWPRARARLVCVSGRWSVSLLARAKARCVATQVEQASSILHCGLCSGAFPLGTSWCFCGRWGHATSSRSGAHVCKPAVRRLSVSWKLD